MSESLSKSFRNLKVMRSPLCFWFQLIFKKRSLSHRDGHHRKKFRCTDGRIYFYGYDVSMKWLIDYATRHWLWDPNDTDYDDLFKISGTLTCWVSKLALNAFVGVGIQGPVSALKLRYNARRSNGRGSGACFVNIQWRGSIVQETAKQRAIRPIVGTYGEAAKVVDLLWRSTDVY